MSELNLEEKVKICRDNDPFRELTNKFEEIAKYFIKKLGWEKFKGCSVTYNIRYLLQNGYTQIWVTPPNEVIDGECPYCGVNIDWEDRPEAMIYVYMKDIFNEKVWKKKIDEVAKDERDGYKRFIKERDKKEKKELRRLKKKYEEK